MNMLRILFFLFLFTIGNAQSGNKEIDSISKLIEKNYVAGDLNPNLTLKHVTALYFMSKEAKFYSGHVTAVFEEARIYYFNGNFDSALAKINEGINLAKAHEDYNMLCQFLLVYHKVLLQLDHLSASKQILTQAEKYNKYVASKDDRLINTIYILLSKADLLIINEDFRHAEQVISLKKLAYSQSLKISDVDKYKKATIIYSLESLTTSLARFEKVAEARECITIIDRYLSTFPDDAFTIQSLIIKGMTEQASENNKMAVNYYNQALIRSKKNNNTYKQYEIYAMISSCYGELKDYKNATVFSKKYKHLVDSIDIVKKRSGDVDFINKINHKVFDRGEKQSVSNIAIIIIISVVFLISGTAVLYHKINSRKKIIKNETVPKLDNSRSSLDYLKNTEIIKTNTENHSNIKPEVTKELVALAKEDINTFFIEFQKVHQSFYLSLKGKYPNLNISDINFCSLIKMNFGIKEISQYTNSTVRATEARRYRIHKKMGIKDQYELYMILSTIN